MIIIIVPTLLTPQHYQRFRSFAMPVYRQHLSWLHGIQYPLAPIFHTVAQIITHPQPWRSLRLRSEIIEKFFGDEHLCCILKLFSPYHFVHHAHIRLNDAYYLGRNVLVHIVGYGDTGVTVANKFYGYVNTL